MPLFGTFDTMPLADLAQWINDSKATGTLTVSVDTEETYVQFEGGYIVAVSTGDPLRLDIGQLLLGRAIISGEQLDEAVSGSRGKDGVVEKLKTGGAVDSDTVDRVRGEQAFEAVLDLFFRDEGSFHFSCEDTGSEILAPHEMSRTARLASPISTRNVVIEAMQRIDDWRRIRDVFPNHFTVVKAVGEGSDDPVWRALEEEGGPISVGDLCVRIGGSRFKIHKALYDLHAVGLVELDELLGGRSALENLGPADVLVSNARVLMEEDQFDEAREILSTATNLDPENEEARELLRSLRKRHLEYLYSQIPPHKIPILEISSEELARLSLPPREAYLASRLIGKWDVGTLVVATPLGELETLRFLRKFLHAGIAAFTS